MTTYDAPPHCHPESQGRASGAGLRDPSLDAQDDSVAMYNASPSVTLSAAKGLSRWAQRSFAAAQDDK